MQNIQPVRFQVRPGDVAASVSRFNSVDAHSGTFSVSHPQSGRFLESIDAREWGPSVNKADMYKEAILKLATIESGLNMFSGQLESLRAMEKLLIVTTVPAPGQTVPVNLTLKCRYVSTNQQFADYTVVGTHTGGVTTRERVIEMPLVSVSVSQRYDNFMKLVHPADSAFLVDREIRRVSTAWDLTKMMMITKAVANMPNIVDIISLDRPPRAPYDPDLFDMFLNMSDFFYGALNIHPESLSSMLSTCAAAKNNGAPLVAVIPDTIRGAISDHQYRGQNGIIKPLDIGSINREIFTYNMNVQDGTDIQPFDFEETSRNIFGDAVAITNAMDDECKVATGPCRPMAVSISLGEETMKAVIVDGTPMNHERDMCVEHYLGSQDCHRTGFFTVGSISEIVKNAAPNTVLFAPANAELNPEAITLRSPSVSYVRSVNCGAVIPVDIAQLHRAMNIPELFAEQRLIDVAAELNRKYQGQIVTFADYENVVKREKFDDRMRFALSLLESDPHRIMVKIKRQAADDFVVRFRVCRFNSSPLQEMCGEFTQVSSELLGMLTPAQRTVITTMCDMVERNINATDMIGIDRLRARNTADNVQDVWFGTDMGNSMLCLSDPVCIIRLARMAANAACDIPANNVWMERAVLSQQFIQFVNMAFELITGGIENTILAHLPAVGYGAGVLGAMSESESRFFRIMVYAWLPTVAANVAVPANANAAVAVQVTPVRGGLGDNYTINSNDGAVFVNENPTAIQGYARFEHDVLNFQNRDTSVVDYPWVLRARALHTHLRSVPKLLISMYYTMLTDRINFLNNFDTRGYYNGISYLVLNPVVFDGYHIGVMGERSLNFTWGACTQDYSTQPDTLVITESREFAVIPKDLTDFGMVLENVYVTNFRNADIRLPKFAEDQNAADAENDYGTCVIADCFNGYMPPTNHSAGGRHHLMAHGKPDPDGHFWEPCEDLKGAYTCMPTLLPESAMRHTISLVAQRATRSSRVNENPFTILNDMVPLEQHKQFLNRAGQDPSSFREGVLRNAMNISRHVRETMHSKNVAVLFCDTYTVGKSSEFMLLGPEPSLATQGIANKIWSRIDGASILSDLHQPTYGGSLHQHIKGTLKTAWRRATLL